MDAIGLIMDAATVIYQLVSQVQVNKKCCQRVAERVKAIVKVIKLEAPSSGSTHIEAALQELNLTLHLAQNLIRKYSDANFLKRLMKANDIGEGFADVNERLNDSYQLLSLAFHGRHDEMLDAMLDSATRHAQDNADRMKDTAELLEMLQENLQGTLATMQERQKTLATREDVQDLKRTIETLSRSRHAVPQDIREIRPDELTYDPIPFTTTSHSEVYKGEYNKFTVAIKRYTFSLSTCPQDVRSVFTKEVETMRRFESPNILRMFGICVQEEHGATPTFLIVMEHCEKGSLRQVLDSRSTLSWTRRARMSLDAARGLYRLHQTEDKSKLHGCINSSKFLVSEGYRVKLGGLELAKTETSLRKMCGGQESSLRYCSPQQLESLTYSYNKKCEIYSFGIVLWEIATRRKPFEDCSSRQEIYNKVSKERFVEPLPEDCPRPLQQLIDTCRTYEAFQRPSAGVLVDKLSRVVERLEEEL